jgi:hypothetical protein
MDGPMERLDEPFKKQARKYLFSFCNVLLLLFNDLLFLTQSSHTCA